MGFIYHPSARFHVYFHAFACYYYFFILLYPHLWPLLTVSLGVHSAHGQNVRTLLTLVHNDVRFANKHVTINDFALHRHNVNDV